MGLMPFTTTCVRPSSAIPDGLAAKRVQSTSTHKLLKALSLQLEHMVAVAGR
jgi:hypothetical protein